MSAPPYDRSYFDREYFELHPGKVRYFAYLLRLLRRHGVTNGPVLDVGAGRGLFLSALARAGMPAVGLEHAPAAAARIRPPARVAVADAELPWPWRDASFSAITMLDVIEHLERADDTLRSCRAALRRDGRLFVLTLSSRSVARLLLGRSWSYHLDTTHVRLYSPRSLAEALERTGWAVVESRTLFNFCVVGEGNPRLRPLRGIGRVVHVPWFGDSMMIVAKPA